MTTETLTGLLKPDGTLELDEAPRLPAGRVEVVLHLLPAPASTGGDWWDYLQRARAQAESSGTRFRTQAEIEADRAAFREGDERNGDKRRIAGADAGQPDA
jgi:hypothetical protein